MVVLQAFLALIAGSQPWPRSSPSITALLQKLTPGWVGENEKDPNPAMSS